MGNVIQGLQARRTGLCDKTQSKPARIALESLQLSRSSNPSVQLIRSLAVSVIALVIDFGLLIILKEEAGLNYLVAATIGYCAGLVVNYWLSITWVFANRKLQNKPAEFTIFTAISLVGLILNGLILSAFVQQAHVDYRVAKLIATVVVFFWNFLARKKVLY